MPFYVAENCGVKKPGFCLRLVVENTAALAPLGDMFFLGICHVFLLRLM
jgi:hypothetical protein